MSKERVSPAMFFFVVIVRIEKKAPRFVMFYRILLRYTLQAIEEICEQRW